MTELQLDMIFDMLFDGINQAFAWFELILTSTHTYEIILGVIVLLIFWRMIITPLFGGGFIASSDGVSRDVQAINRSQSQVVTTTTYSKPVRNPDGTFTRTSTTSSQTVGRSHSKSESSRG